MATRGLDGKVFVGTNNEGLRDPSKVAIAVFSWRFASRMVSFFGSRRTRNGGRT
jgi:hypothetical protein